jgi:hypothetical protein
MRIFCDVYERYEVSEESFSDYSFPIENIIPNLVTEERKTVILMHMKPDYQPGTIT